MVVHTDPVRSLLRRNLIKSSVVVRIQLRSRTVWCLVNFLLGDENRGAESNFDHESRL